MCKWNMASNWLWTGQPDGGDRCHAFLMPTFPAISAKRVLKERNQWIMVGFSSGCRWARSMSLKKTQVKRRRQAWLYVQDLIHLHWLWQPARITAATFENGATKEINAETHSVMCLVNTRLSSNRFESCCIERHLKCCILSICLQLDVRRVVVLLSRVYNRRWYVLSEEGKRRLCFNWCKVLNNSHSLQSNKNSHFDRRMKRSKLLPVRSEI